VVGKRQRSCYAIDLKLQSGGETAARDSGPNIVDDYSLARPHRYTGKICPHRTDMSYYEYRTLVEEEGGNRISSNSRPE
jgi:hypothetical protein